MTRLFTAIVLLTLGALPCLALTPPDDATGLSAPCANIPHADHPKVMLSNGDTQLVLFLPDSQNGYYRAARFDWSGVIACASFNGHTYFGEWFKHYDPLLNDSITGPVEEFRTEDGAIGYADAAPGGLFVKPGVGVLRKIDNNPYKFGFPYPLVDSGTWSVHSTDRSITLEQKLQGPNGIGYVYTKTVSLEPHGGTITLRHTLRNTGSASITTDVYDHDFFMLDGRPTGPGMMIRFPFAPRLQRAPDPEVTVTNPEAEIQGKEIVYVHELAAGETYANYLSGYSDKASDYDLTVEDHNTGVGVEQTSTSPLAKLYLWSIRTTICPEAYIHLDIPAGKSKDWMIRYRLYGPPAGKTNAAAAPAPHPN